MKINIFTEIFQSWLLVWLTFERWHQMLKNVCHYKRPSIKSNGFTSKHTFTVQVLKVDETGLSLEAFWLEVLVYLWKLVCQILHRLFVLHNDVLQLSLGHIQIIIILFTKWDFLERDFQEKYIPLLAKLVKILLKYGFRWMCGEIESKSFRKEESSSNFKLLGAFLDLTASSAQRSLKDLCCCWLKFKKCSNCSKKICDQNFFQHEEKCSKSNKKVTKRTQSVALD